MTNTTPRPDAALRPPQPGNAVWGPPTTPVGVPAGAFPMAPQLQGTQFKGPREPHETLPMVIGVGALVVLTASLLISKVILDLLIDFEWPVAVYVVVLGLIGYGPSIAWWKFATSRWGSGNSIEDVGASPRWADLGWGPVIWIATVAVQLVVGAIVLGLDIPLASNTDDVGEFSADRTYTVAIVITAVVAAPIVEELVFRGMVMRSLLSKMPAAIAIVLQGVLFGVAHIDPVRGVGNIGLAMVLSGVGTSLGAAAYLLRRIGPTMVAHAIFNGVVMALLLSGVQDWIRENNPDVFEDSVAEQVAVVDQANVTEPHGSGDPHGPR